jgi:hypothetical protein
VNGNAERLNTLAQFAVVSHRDNNWREPLSPCDGQQLVKNHFRAGNAQVRDDVKDA